MFMREYELQGMRENPMSLEDAINTVFIFAEAMGRANNGTPVKDDKLVNALYKVVHAANGTDRLKKSIDMLKARLESIEKDLS